jgi:hypothetical protein
MYRRLEIIKMGIMDKFMNAMRLNADDEEYYDDEIYDEPADGEGTGGFTIEI